MELLGLRCLTVLVALGCASGCGDKGPPTGAVQGTITYRGQAVREAFVIFENTAKGWTRSATLNADGSYQHGEVPVAEYVVCVIPPEPKLPDETSGVRVRGDSVAPPPMPDPENIPRRFRTRQSTPLRANIVKGTNRCDFELARQ